MKMTNYRARPIEPTGTRSKHGNRHPLFLTMYSNADGFTLLELIITVALIAIVTIIGTTSYRQYMLRANRTDAGAVLLRIAAAQERWFLDNNQYADDPNDLIGDDKSEHGYYAVTIERDADPATGYKVSAKPVPDGRQANDKDCQELSMDETGLRESSPNDIDDCWR